MSLDNKVASGAKRRKVSSGRRDVKANDEPALPSTRRRGAALEESLLQAAWDELLEVGYSRLSMESIAARARTGKQVLYRRWPNRAQVTLAAVRHVLGPLIERTPDTGSLREDVLTVLRLMVARGRRVPMDKLQGLLLEMPDLAAGTFAILPGVMAEILARARQRGEIGPAPLSPRVISLPIDLMRYESVLAVATPVDIVDDVEVERLLAEIVDDIFLPLVRTTSTQPPA